MMEDIIREKQILHPTMPNFIIRLVKLTDNQQLTKHARQAHIVKVIKIYHGSEETIYQDYFNIVKAHIMFTQKVEDYEHGESCSGIMKEGRIPSPNYI